MRRDKFELPYRVWLTPIRDLPGDAGARQRRAGWTHTRETPAVN
jgi:hypothetical protein